MKLFGTQERGNVGPVGLIVLICAVALAGDSAPDRAQWPQWGGVNRDFKAIAVDLADTWPALGPKRLWRRSLGEGRAAVVVDGDVAYALYRVDENGGIDAVFAKNGVTKWSYRFPAPPYEQQRQGYGDGPGATPLLVDEYVIIISSNGLIQCIAKATADVIWTHDLVKEFGGIVQEFGYCASPLSYKGSVIVLVGGAKHGVIAFNVADGAVAWASEPVDVSYASPILINVDGQDQIVLMSSTEVIGLEAGSGRLLWRRPHANKERNNFATPIWGKDNLLFVSSHAGGGSRVLKLTQKDGKTTVKQLWHNLEMQMHRTNAVRIGDYIYGCAGDDASSPFAALNVKTGKIAWKESGFPRASCTYADGKMFILDEQGTLSVAAVSPQKLTLHATIHLLEHGAWTAPTVVDKKLFIRDQNVALVFDVGKTD